MSPKPSFESQKPSKNDPKTIKRTKVRPEDVFLSFFCIFGRFLVAQGPPKIKPKSKQIWKNELKIDLQKTHVFRHVFLMIFHGFDLPKWSQFWCFLTLFRKHRFCEKPCFSLVKSMILRVGASKKRCKIDPKTQSQKALPKSSRKSAWGVDLGSILGGFWLQKWKKVEKIEDEILSRILEAKKSLGSTASAE